MTTQKGPVYWIEINPISVRLPTPSSDLQYRGVIGILRERGFHGGLSGNGDFDWRYQPDRELDSETIAMLEEIPGVKVRK